MTDEQKPPIDVNNFDGIMLTQARMCCSLHGEPFRAQYPKGVPIFMVHSFQMVTAIPGIWEEARRIAGAAPDTELHPKTMEAVLDVKPICCRLTRKQLFDCYIESKVGTMGRCRVCHRKGIGTEYKTATQFFAHLCFECVCSASSSPQDVH